MIKSENDILYNRLKNNVGFFRSTKFKKWFHDKYIGCEMHHCFGSVSQNLKTSDYCSIPVVPNHAESRAEKDKSNFAIEHLPDLINVLQCYIIYLENKK
jgi:hypothetical protein